MHTFGVLALVIEYVSKSLRQFLLQQVLMFVPACRQANGHIKLKS